MSSSDPQGTAPDRYVAVKRIHERARQFRGRFLNHIASIERDLALLLTDYFCTDDRSKQKLFFERIACRMSLDEKRVALIEIVKSDYPNYWEENVQFLNDLTELQRFRNKLAHSVVDVSDAALARPIEQGVGFVDWKEGDPITDVEFDDWCARANMVATTLIEIRKLLPYKQRKDSSKSSGSKTG
jgi:hypothetical protein